MQKAKSLKRVGKGPFRGPTPEGVFQTIDVGAGTAKWLRQQARKFPRRKYVAVEPFPDRNLFLEKNLLLVPSIFKEYLAVMK
ncbi:MAG: hypothetical protein J4478_02920 [Candidatus Diapherotrites archaeon]|uniref:Uncharacterized protein n=1 Tax=Candidatus Iainarchaeum sp. TaxID=3101447 RepID=A0A7J4JYN0_9ARCH|nr:MAG: hypothetical protein QT12_C0020G0013 [archaeon GW2011_AR21]MBS3058329.1 hypothetical protein [Candidatus Diapherotrites archaeon]HIH22080.1 hypothetical protein [Candidatus Diapherotrites archaeon]HIH33470.1 hypothetical protein [Candidatus Diapherotrites archaeon]